MFTSYLPLVLLTALSVAIPLYQVPFLDSAAASTTSTHPANPTAVLNALVLAVTEEQRLNILVPDPSNPANLTFQFVNNTVTPPNGGTIDLATVANFPALLGTNVAQALGFVNPCGLNTPHSHPRANEFLTVVEGSLIGGLITENNPGSFGVVEGGDQDPEEFRGPLPQITTKLGKYMGTLFPQGAIHFQFNPTCEPALFVAAFDNNDPGRIQIARSFFSITEDKVIETSLGDMDTITPKNIDVVREFVPSSFANVIDSCAKRCGIAVGSDGSSEL